MALIIFDKGTLSGKLGDSVYMSNGRVRQFVMPSNPASVYQDQCRAAAGFLSAYWTNQLSAAERDSWATYAANVKVLDRLGRQITLSGQQHFIRSNAQRKRLAQTVIDQAPAVMNLGELTMPSASGFVAGPPSTVNVAFTTTDDWHAAGGHLYFYASRPQSPTINFFINPYRYMADIAGTDASPVNNVVLPFNAVAGQRIFFRAIASCADGRLSQEVRFQLDT